MLNRLVSSVITLGLSLPFSRRIGVLCIVNTDVLEGELFNHYCNATHVCIIYNYLLNCQQHKKKWQKESLSDVRLHAAARRGDLVVIRHLLDSGRVYPDCRDKVCTFVCLKKININFFLSIIYIHF